MGNSEQDSNSGIPAWQRSQSAAADPRSDPPVPEATATIDQARKFLEDEEVQKDTRERKVEFLKSKGIEEGVILELLDEEGKKAPPKAVEDAAQEPATASTSPDTVTAEAKEDRPPIVTYPEFLTKPARAPPLVTANGFLNTLYAFAGISTLIYGTSNFVLTPMVESLTEARVSLHDTANQNLGKLVTKLEDIVSEIPGAKKADSTGLPFEDDEDTEYDDPTEMFHRDIGVQTSLPSSPVEGTGQTLMLTESPSIQQARRLRELVASAKEISGGIIAHSEDYADVKTLLDVFKDEMDQLSYPIHDFVGSSSLYGGINRNEPDDEIKRAKENIRRVKGVLLSARSFPAGTR